MADKQYVNGNCPVCDTPGKYPKRPMPMFIPYAIWDDKEGDVGYNRGLLQMVCEMCHCIFVKFADDDSPT